MPVFGIADPQLDGLSAPTQISDLAQLYARSLLEYHCAHYSGGFYIGGWSMGGTVAQSVAHIFQTSPDMASLLWGLLMLDSHSPDHIRHLSGMDSQEVNAEFARRYRGSLQEFSGLSSRTSEDVSPSGLRAFTRHLIGLADMEAPAVAELPVLLVVADDQSPVNSGVGMGVDDARDYPLLGWGDNLPRTTRVLHVPGYHYSILHESVIPIATAIDELVQDQQE